MKIPTTRCLELKLIHQFIFKRLCPNESTKYWTYCYFLYFILFSKSLDERYKGNIQTHKSKANRHCHNKIRETIKRQTTRYDKHNIKKNKRLRSILEYSYFSLTISYCIFFFSVETFWLWDNSINNRSHYPESLLHLLKNNESFQFTDILKYVFHRRCLRQTEVHSETSYKQCRNICSCWVKKKLLHSLFRVEQIL